ncbi:hypothetical protein [Pontibacter liquoris]|uniref:hypothetical protein n=1 Tax=Pontibacter liquoris TaxID=2905677 RepID=UPI001FA7EEBD|nr:hypothetical protein [Pontibacter liquoris]
MILFQNSLIKLDYHPATDIAVAEYPDLHSYLLPEIKHSIDLVVDTLRSYDVKLLILDGTRTVSTVESEQGREIATYLAAGLRTTRLQKLARMQSSAGLVEKRAQDNIKHIELTQAPAFQIQAFTSREEATAWLLKNA